MHAHAGRSNKKRRYGRKQDITVIVFLCVVVVLGAVAFLMYLLTSPSWLPRGN